MRQYDRAVLRLAIHLTGSPEDGQDIYQEAFLRAYINLARFRFECSFYTWIYRIVTNLCLDHLRKKQFPRPGLEYDDVSRRRAGRSAGPHARSQPGCQPGAKLCRTRTAAMHRQRALGRLSPRERMVFELKHYHGMRLRTVAGMLNTTEGTIKNTLFRATHKLRTQLAEVR